MLPKGLQLGHYRLLQQIGSGGMGEVYLAEDTRIARQVAVKIVRVEPEPYLDEQSLQNAARLFNREMRAISMLDHPNILHLIDFGEQSVDGVQLTYMIMPYRPEGSLAEWLQRCTEKLPLNDVAHFVNQAADALQHAHDHQLIHQDVKPSNFLLRNRQSHPNRPDILLTDFGIAKFNTTSSTKSQSVRGTPAFMAPEQWESRPVPASDQYSLAIMAYQLLTGHTPFVGRMEQVMHQHFMAQPQPPSRYNVSIPPALDAVILRALAKQPAERYPSISDFARAFQQAIQQPEAGELRTTLNISKAEALAGSERIITLPGGRRIAITIPKDAYDGQIIRLNEQGEQLYQDGPRGPLILTLAISQKDMFRPSISGEQERIAPAPVPPPPPPGYAAAPYPSPYTSNYSNIPATTPSLNPNYSTSATTGPEVLPSDKRGSSSPDFARDRGSRRRGVRMLVLAALALIILVGSIFGFTTYQNSMNATHAAATASAQTALVYSNATATIAQATARVNATTTAVARATEQVIANNPYPSYLSGKGTFAYSDPLSQPAHWKPGSDVANGGFCSFKDNSYHVNQTHTSHTFHCDDESTNFSNFALEIQVTILKGDCGGVIFRATPNSFYEFRFCKDGNYYLSLYVDQTGSNAKNLTGNSSSNIRPDTNLLAIVANNNTIDMYLNNQKVDSITDSTYSRGHLGVIADAHTSPTEVKYSNIKVWNL